MSTRIKLRSRHQAPGEVVGAVAVVMLSPTSAGGIGAGMAVGFQVPQTLDRFKLWGACGDLNLPSLPTRDPPKPSASGSKKQRDTSVYLVRATLRCNTLLQRFWWIASKG